MKTTLEDLAKLQPMRYFVKYQGILIHNLMMSLHRANWERNRTEGDYSLTAEIINLTETKRILEEVWFLEDIIEVKAQMKRKKSL